MKTSSVRAKIVEMARNAIRGLPKSDSRGNPDERTTYASGQLGDPAGGQCRCEGVRIGSDASGNEPVCDENNRNRSFIYD